MSKLSNLSRIATKLIFFLNIRNFHHPVINENHWRFATPTDASVLVKKYLSQSNAQSKFRSE